MSTIISVYSSSRIGRAHKENGLQNQDAVSVFENERIALAVLSDGVSECEFGGQGAEAAVKVTERLLVKNHQKLWKMPPQKTVGIILNEVRHGLSSLADGNLSQYAGTLCFALLDKVSRRLMLFKLGDSNVYLFSKDGCALFGKGQGADTRFTVSPDAEAAAELEMVDGVGLTAVMLCSDGAWRSMYDGNRLKDELTAAAVSGDTETFKQHFDSQESTDDSSFALIHLSNN